MQLGHHTLNPGQAKVKQTFINTAQDVSGPRPIFGTTKAWPRFDLHVKHTNQKKNDLSLFYWFYFSRNQAFVLAVGGF